MAEATSSQQQQQQAGEQAKVQGSQKTDLKQQPAWVEFDKKVLRFYAFETINMPENPDESIRVRKYIFVSSFLEEK